MISRRAIEVIVSAALALGLVVAGFLHKGVRAAQVVLNDGGSGSSTPSCDSWDI